MDDKELFEDFINDFISAVENGFKSRMDQITPDLYSRDKHETSGALLSRQAVLAIEMAQSPTIWNPHIAPIILRCMTDAYITIAWILDDPTVRSRQYIEYGLGQEKLCLEHLEASLSEEEESEEIDAIKEMVEYKKAWLNSQQADWSIDVNVGSWSETSTRDMAIKIGRESIYKHAYVPFSASVHNMWHHTGRYNIRHCENPMHKWHLVPSLNEYPIEIDFLYRAAKYVTITYELYEITYK